MANRRGLAFVVGLVAPALACTAVTGLGKSYEFLDDGGTMTTDSGGSDALARADAAEAAPPAATCPNVLGSYTMDQTGSDCQDFNKGAKQCISATVLGNCSLKFHSTVPTTMVGVNGFADLAPDGTFKSAMLDLGTHLRMGCTGAWNEAAGTMVVNCGGDGSQGCTVTMTRIAGAPACD